MEDYIEKIIVPNFQHKREKLKHPADARSLVLFDNFNGQCTSSLLKLLDDNNINVVIILPNCTDRLQPLDLSFYEPVKECLCNKSNSGILKKYHCR